MVAKMNAEARALDAIQRARNRLSNMLLSPTDLILLVAHDVSPEEIEDKIAEILAYLEKTKEEKPSEKPSPAERYRRGVEKGVKEEPKDA